MAEHTLIIGERINPTGRPRLAEQLAKGDLETALADARAQAEAGADVIDVNVGVPGVDEVPLLERAALEVAEATGLPVCIDSSDPAALAAVLPALPEGTFVNSVTGDAEALEVLLPPVAESGAMLIAMAKDMSGIPETADDRIEVARRIVEAAAGHGIPPERILIDFLTLPVATDPGSAVLACECIRRAGKELGAGTVLGASNISFGMPTRNILNSAFLAMAVEAGLTAAILNPLEEGVVQAVLAADVIAGRDPRGRRFLKDFRARRAAPRD
ncbi:MAG: dihydropteroate synthase [Actinomycetota bacterium]